MSPEETYNALPEGFEGEQKRRTEFDSAEEKLSYDADGLIALAKKTYKKEIVTVGEVVDLATRLDDNVDDLRRAIAIELKNPEKVVIDKRLLSLVVEPINALPEAKRTVRGKVRSGKEIAKAIPDIESFFTAMSARREGKFFELNEAGQLVMADGCPEAYGVGEDFPTAKKRQTGVYYRGEDGATQFMKGDDYYTVKEVDRGKWGRRSKMKIIELSEAAKKIPPASIIMESGLPTLKRDGNPHTGEYARMNTGQLERSHFTWTDDDSLNASLNASPARIANWSDFDGKVISSKYDSGVRSAGFGSRGVLRVNLNLES